MEKVFKINHKSGQLVSEISVEQFDKERKDKDGTNLCGEIGWHNPVCYVGYYMYVYYNSEYQHD